LAEQRPKADPLFPLARELTKVFPMSRVPRDICTDHLKHMKNILLPTDFSETSHKAAVFAMDLFGTEGTQYTLLNTYLKQAYRNALMPLQLDTERASRNGLRRMERRCRNHAGKVH